MLQYGDDTIFLLDDDVDNAKNLKLVFYAFEKMLGLKMNFHKSELMLFEDVMNKKNIYQKTIYM